MLFKNHLNTNVSNRLLIKCQLILVIEFIFMHHKVFLNLNLCVRITVLIHIILNCDNILTNLHSILIFLLNIFLILDQFLQESRSFLWNIILINLVLRVSKKLFLNMTMILCNHNFHILKELIFLYLNFSYEDLELFLKTLSFYKFFLTNLFIYL